MTLTVHRFGSAAALALMLGLLGLLSGSEPFAQGQPGCTVTVKPGQSIQKAIDAASEGAVVCLEAGTWQENLKIEKGLTLRGAGWEQTKIMGREEYKSIIRITSKAEVTVGIESFTVAEAKPSADGIEIGSKARVIISNSQILRNRAGIDIGDSAQAAIKNSLISNNGYGIVMLGSAQLTITDSQVLNNNWGGIVLNHSARVSITNSQLSGSGGNGVSIEDSAQATIENNAIQGNKWCGISSSSDKPIQGEENFMEGNGADLCGNLSARLRKPLEQETLQKELSFPGPYATLQRTVDALAPGGTITIVAGEHQGGVTIWKPLRLQGVGQEQARLRGMVSLINEAQGVQIEGVMIVGSPLAGLLLGGQAYMTIADSQIANSWWHGVWLWGSAQATISNSQILSNQGSGIWLGYSAQATISSSQISDNKFDGITIVDQAHAAIFTSQILGNKFEGILIGDLASVSLSKLTISSNGRHGIWLGDSAQATIRDNTISGNENGIGMVGSSQATILDNKIVNNGEYGVVCYQRPCFDIDWEFEGAVRGSSNEISGNKKADVCPEDLKFLMTPTRGCYGPKC